VYVESPVHCLVGQYQSSSYFVPDSWAKYCYQLVCVCMSVYVYVSRYLCSHIYKNTCSNSTKFSVHITCDRSSVLFRRQCNMLCISGFVDDVMLSRNGSSGPESKTICFVDFAAPRAKLLFTIAGLSSVVVRCRCSRELNRFGCATLTSRQKAALSIQCILYRHRITFLFDVCVCVCLSVNRSVVERLRPQLFTGFHKFCDRLGNVVGSSRIVCETGSRFGF